MNIYYNVLSMEERAASAGVWLLFLFQGLSLSLFPSHPHKVLTVRDKNNFYYGEKKKWIYRNFHEKEEKKML